MARYECCFNVDEQGNAIWKDEENLIKNCDNDSIGYSSRGGHQFRHIAKKEHGCDLWKFYMIIINCNV